MHETNSLIGALIISRELNESHLSLASDWYANYIIGSIIFDAIRRNPVTHLKSTNEIHCHKAHAGECSGPVVECLTPDREFEPHRRHCVVVLEQDTLILA